MLLHNQRGAAITWDGEVEYKWEPYGACEVPDVLVPLIKSTGFPVDVAPVPPKEKAERAAALTTEAESALELERVRQALASAEARAVEAKAAAEAADIRATAVRAEADAIKEELRVRTEELRSARSDAAGFEKLIVEKTAELAKLKEQLKVEQAKHAAPETKKK